jgi:hypothetical protein
LITRFDIIYKDNAKEGIELCKPGTWKGGFRPLKCSFFTVKIVLG